MRGIKGNQTASSGVTGNLGQTTANPGNPYLGETGGADGGGDTGVSGKSSKF